jgi:hypothetical protein
MDWPSGVQYTPLTLWHKLEALMKIAKIPRDIFDKSLLIRHIRFFNEIRGRLGDSSTVVASVYPAGSNAVFFRFLHVRPRIYWSNIGVPMLESNIGVKLERTYCHSKESNMMTRCNWEPWFSNEYVRLLRCKHAVSDCFLPAWWEYQRRRGFPHTPLYDIYICVCKHMYACTKKYTGYECRIYWC